MTHDFEKALEYIGSKHYHPHDIMRAYHKEIQLALRIADRLQKGDVSDGMYDVGDNLCMSFADRNEFPDAEEVFKAMSQQLFKECGDV